MEILTDIFRFLHLLGFASVFGGLLMQLGSDQPQVNSAMLHGSLFQLVTGIVLVFLVLPEVSHIKIGVKFILLVGVLVLFFIGRKRGFNRTAYLSALTVVLVITAVAVLWPGVSA